MTDVSIVVMGKTGAGKSTLVNALLNQNVAKTGMGNAVTYENQLYSGARVSPSGIKEYNLKVYDTIGLEIDEDKRESVLWSIKDIIRDVSTEEGVNTVWYCVNGKGQRLEDSEKRMIVRWAEDLTIPFIIVITQCISEDADNLERVISRELPNYQIVKILAEPYKTRSGIIDAFGVDDLLIKTVKKYRTTKKSLLQEKEQRLGTLKRLRVARLEREGKNIIKKYARLGTGLGLAPAGGIVSATALFRGMINELNNLADLEPDDNEADQIVSTVTKIAFTPLLAIPISGSIVSNIYIKKAGERYLEVLKECIWEDDDEIINIRKLIRKL